MSSMKGIAYWVVTMHKMGKPTEEIQALLDSADVRDSKREVCELVTGFINSITQQQIKEKLNDSQSNRVL